MLPRTEQGFSTQAKCEQEILSVHMLYNHSRENANEGQGPTPKQYIYVIPPRVDSIPFLVLGGCQDLFQTGYEHGVAY